MVTTQSLYLDLLDPSYIGSDALTVLMHRVDLPEPREKNNCGSTSERVNRRWRQQKSTSSILPSYFKLPSALLSYFVKPLANNTMRSLFSHFMISSSQMETAIEPATGNFNTLKLDHLDISLSTRTHIREWALRVAYSILHAVSAGWHGH